VQGAFCLAGIDSYSKSHIKQETCCLTHKVSMTRPTAVTFQRKFGIFQYQSQREPVETRLAQVGSVSHYDWLTAAAHRTSRTADTPAVVIETVRRAAMDPLNMRTWTI
jgi:hypothetical protein